MDDFPTWSVWALPAVHFAGEFTAVAGFLMIASLVAAVAVPSRRTMQALAATFGVAMISAAGFIGTTLFYNQFGSRAVYMAQCVGRFGTKAECLKSFSQIYPGQTSISADGSTDRH